MKRIPYPLIIIAGLGLLWAACSKDRAAELRGDWLFPIAKGAFSINTLSTLENLEYEIDIPALSLGVPEGVSVSSPGLRISHVGPFAVRIADWLRRIDIDTLEFSGNLENFFPVPIGAGTRITMRNSRDTSAASTIGEMTINRDVAPGERFDFRIDVYGKTLIDSAYFYLDDFRSPAYANVTFTTRPTRLRIRLGVVAADYLEIYTNKRFASTDTTAFSAGSDDLSGTTNLNDSAARGTIKVFCDNGLPAAVNGQIYFMDASRSRITDSLFPADLQIRAGQTDVAGATTLTYSTEQSILISSEKLERIKSAGFIVTRFIVSSEGIAAPYVGANREASLRLQFTGDLNITVRF